LVVAWRVAVHETVSCRIQSESSRYLNIPPHLKYVATLPCELSVQKIAMLKKQLKQTAMEEFASQKVKTGLQQFDIC